MTERADQFHHDNVPVHSTALVQVFFFLAKHHITHVYKHPPSPHLAPCGFWLFPKLESPLKGRRSSRPRDRFSRYSKWLDTFRTALVYTHTNTHTHTHTHTHIRFQTTRVIMFVMLRKSLNECKILRQIWCVIFCLCTFQVQDARCTRFAEHRKNLRVDRNA
jgi:hypothetical protein